MGNGETGGFGCELAGLLANKLVSFFSLGWLDGNRDRDEPL